jgi:hypothetical protein
MKFEDISEIEKQLPMKLEDAIEKHDGPFVIYKDDWRSFEFIVMKVAKDKGKLRVFGKFAYNGILRDNLQELFRTGDKFRVKEYDPEAYK